MSISSKDIYKEIISPEDFDKMLKDSDNLSEVLSKIYKIEYMNLRLNLDIRNNTMKISQGRKINFKDRPPQADNPVIKDKDNIK